MKFKKMMSHFTRNVTVKTLGQTKEVRTTIRDGECQVLLG